MIQIAEPVTLEKLLPLIKNCRKWNVNNCVNPLKRTRRRGEKEWDNIVGQFHDAFADTPEEEVTRDIDEALAEVRHGRI